MPVEDALVKVLRLQTQRRRIQYMRRNVRVDYRLRMERIKKAEEKIKLRHDKAFEELRKEVLPDEVPLKPYE